MKDNIMLVLAIKDISGYPGYKITSTGKVYSKYKRNKGKYLKQSLSHKNGYSIIQVVNDNGIKNKSIHRLVAQAFIPNPENKPCVNHINGIKTDNRIENLEWVSFSENRKHAWETGLVQNTDQRSKKISESKKGKKQTSEHIRNVIEAKKKNKQMRKEGQ